jgi:hypothetical protein
MAPQKLSEDVSLEHVVATLVKPEEYVRRIAFNMERLMDERKTAFVALGTTGKGFAPHYRIAPAPLSEWPAADDYDSFFVAFNGRSHNQMQWGQGELQRHHWSSTSTHYDEVRMLLGRLRAERKR